MPRFGLALTTILFATPLLMGQGHALQVLDTPAPASPPTTRPASSTTELDKLREENALLKRQVADLRKQVDDLRMVRRLPTRIDDKPTKTGPYEPVEKLLARIPDGLKPDATQEWNQFSFPKFQKWVQEEEVGTTFDGVVNVLQTQAAFAVQQQGQKEAKYATFIQFQPNSFIACGTDHKWTIRIQNAMLSEANARIVSQLKKGMPVHVTGKIRDVRTELDLRNHYMQRSQVQHFSIVLELEEVEIKSVN